MAGLLDDFAMPGMDTPQGQGLLAAAFSLMNAKGPSMGNAIGQAGQQYMGTYNHSRDADQARKFQELQARHVQMQMDEQAQKTAMEKMAYDRAIAKQKALPSLWTGGQSALSPLAGDPSIGILPSAGRPAIAGKFDVQAALQAGYSPDEIAKLDGLRNVGMDEVARTMKGMVNGREVDQQMDKFGRPVGSGMEQYRAPIEMATGAQKLLLDPFTRTPLSTFNMEQDPNSKASTALGWANRATTERGQDMNDARARDLNAIKRNEVTSVKDQAKSSQLASFDTMLGTLGRLSDHPGLSRSVGAIGAFPTMPGSESANFKAELDTFQSQAFLPMVSQLKGMGALSDAEGKKITAAVGALNPNMGEKAFRESIKRITADMNSARDRLSGIPQSAPPAQSKPAIPMKGMVQGGYKFKGGEASNPSNWEKQ